ncbi:MAG: hypothetical protein ACRD9R_16135 [Pyrinomonadaceae bacterium]
MKQTIVSRLTLFAVCLALAALVTTAPPAASQSAGEALKPAEQDDETASRAEHRRSRQRPRISVAPVLNFSDRAVVPAAGSLLARNRDGVFMNLHTSGLAAGTVVTAWWVIFNNPRECATSPCSVADLPNPAVQSSLVNAAGRIIGADGTASYGDFLAVGDTTGAFTGPGLLNAFKAEIHLVTRTHGAALLGDPATLAQQLSTFNGGCPPNMCANLQTSIHQP